ncbi:MAG: GspE/PulE family protein [Candidatus Paceibacterota bacterium]|jgi:type IV pilus assembly protein PilB
MALSSGVQDQLLKMQREAEERDAQRRAQERGMTYLPPDKVLVNLEALEVIAHAQATEGHLVPIAIREKKLAAVLYDPKLKKTHELLAALVARGYEITTYVVSLSSLSYALDFYKFIKTEKKTIAGEVDVEATEGDLAKADITAFDTLPKVQKLIDETNNAGKISDIVRVVLLGAMGNKASDIHFEPGEDTVRLRYRIDGLLNDVYTKFAHGVYRSVLSRIKMLSNLKLNVRDEPQDGRFTIDLSTKKVEVRVAIAPSEYGEVVVMRLLDPDAINLSLEQLGLRPDDLKIVLEQLDRPNGMAINTGPTGSGKTTTLYAFLRRKADMQTKIITIEDPIEYHIDGIEQTQINEEAGYTFAGGLRSLMRQDPDIILVGEIRDKDTAEIATQAALTGHLVFSTVHANSSAGAIPRLLDLGVKALSLAPALNLLIAQRLVRRLCTACRQPVAMTDDMQKKLEIFLEKLPPRIDKKPYGTMALYKPTGCEKCNDTGYKGRVAVYELMVVSPTIQELIIAGVGQLAIEKEVAKTDFVSMQQDGILKIISGMTTFEEVEETTGKIVWEKQ